MDTQVKRCADCKIEKVLADFGPTTQQLKFGVKSRCRDCEKEYKRKWVQADPVRRARQDEATRNWQANNREKVRAWNRDYKKRRFQEKPEQFRAYERKCRLKRMYGVTPEWFDEQAEKQNGMCKICGGPPESKGLCIDHNHKTGQVRALLCTRCNTALHKMENDLGWIRKAEAYLLEF
jgi:hypothetical protein